MNANAQSQALESSNRRRVAGVALAAAVGLLALAGCGSSSSSSTSSTTSTPAAPTGSTGASTGASSAGETLGLAANNEGQLAFDKKTLSAKAGAISIVFSNPSPLPHNVTIESSSGQRLGGTETFAGGAKTLKVTLKAGTYKFFCSVPGHRQAGMEGTLTVQ